MNYPLPLHPIAVHLPISLGILMPLVLTIVYFQLAKKKWAYGVFVWPFILQLLLVLSGVMAMKLGELDESKVEAVVEKVLIHEHEQWAERWVWYQGGVLVLMGLCLLLPGRLRIKRTALVLSILGAFFTAYVGHTGGELVYKYNAGRAYLSK